MNINEMSDLKKACFEKLDAAGINCVAIGIAGGAPDKYRLAVRISDRNADLAKVRAALDEGFETVLKRKSTDEDLDIAFVSEIVAQGNNSSRGLSGR